jgi:hypothetical protein
LLFSCLSGVALRTGRSGWTSGTNKPFFPFFPFFPFYPGTASFPGRSRGPCWAFKASGQSDRSHA